MRFWAQSSGIVSRLIGPLRPAAQAMGFAIAREDGRITPLTTHPTNYLRTHARKIDHRLLEKRTPGAVKLGSCLTDATRETAPGVPVRERPLR